ncbi:translation initiation factor IF-2 [Candidatus Bandiella euplotis]|uniref:Translation initiation factor IF-2 n=1 Tax=Candidatus Bandiella euplotis TaxID=1664265 RepID=A0ABZ0UPK3_9RICK|nr:translation initiation factor IF-2 [Candidatus Bandiella woodruffii]WPX96810.1 Translation initiation factor IF-2 [Candidatus Bandiella woodruffii]
MTEDKTSSKQQQKKTLGLSGKPLGLKLPAAKLAPGEFAITKQQRGKGAGTVVVVTKSKSAKDGVPYGMEDDKLTSQEKENRLNALRQAEKTWALSSGDKKNEPEETKTEAVESADIKETSSEENIVELAKQEVKTPDEGNSGLDVKNIESFRSNVDISSNKLVDLNYIDRKKSVGSTASVEKSEEKGADAKKTTEFKRKGEKANIVIDDTEEEKRGVKKKKGVDAKDLKKFSLSQVFRLEQNEDAVETRVTTIRRNPRNKHKDSGSTKQEKVFREVKIPEEISVQELANRMTEKVGLVIKTLMKLGVVATINQSIDADTAELVVQELGHKPIRATDVEMEKILFHQEEDSESSLEPRAPVVTIMGHVDHGKTSLLDALRSTDVAAGEHGGITQHIGAYKVSLGQGQSITFLDTPGHEAFTAMRMRGAKVTDIVIIVVAADDGIKEQTIEAINHAKAAQVPIIVAINKIDKPGANIEKVKTSLFNYELVPEDMGGDTMVVLVSAKEKKGLDVLEESILIQAEMLELKANYNRRAEGVVIESKVDKTKGALATLLVQKGTLKIGDIVVIKDKYCKIRALIDDKGQRVPESIPSTPVEVLGLDQAPDAGEKFVVVENEKIAKKIVEFEEYKEGKNISKNENKLSFETLLKNQANTNLKTLNITLKADVHGSLEAIKNSLQKLSNEEVEIKIVHSSVGSIIESDMSLAKVTNSVVLGFNVRADSKTKKAANDLGIEIRYYSVIYDLIDEVEGLINGLISPVHKEKIIGYAEIRQVFNITKFGKVAGCMVTEGTIKRKAFARLLRDNIVVYDGKLSALKRFKDDAKEVKAGFECGMSFEKFNDIKVNDIFEVYETVEEPRA